jgi:hypothetical protein
MLWMKAVTASERVFDKFSSTKVTPRVDIRDDKVLGFVSHTRRAQAFVSLSLLLLQEWRRRGVVEEEKW